MLFFFLRKKKTRYEIHSEFVMACYNEMRNVYSFLFYKIKTNKKHNFFNSSPQRRIRNFPICCIYLFRFLLSSPSRVQSLVAFIFHNISFYFFIYYFQILIFVPWLFCVCVYVCECECLRNYFKYSTGFNASVFGIR